MAATAPGDSSAQREAEAGILSSLSTKLGIDLGKRKFEVEGGRLEIDGVGGAPPTILVEVWAHLGKPKSAQKSKVMKDAFKLLYASSLLTRQGFPKPRLMLAFADETPRVIFGGIVGWLTHLMHKALSVSSRHCRPTFAPQCYTRRSASTDDAHTMGRPRMS